MKRFRIELPVFILLIKPLFNEKFETFSRLQILKIKRGFEDYLVAFNNDQLLDLPSSPYKVIQNLSHPLKTNGFNPETVLHFIEFAKTFEVKTFN